MRVTVSPLTVLSFFIRSLSPLYLLNVKCKGLLLQLITVNNIQLVVGFGPKQRPLPDNTQHKHL
jgi:hypothetical protein